MGHKHNHKHDHHHKHDQHQNHEHGEACSFEEHDRSNAHGCGCGHTHSHEMGNPVVNIICMGIGIALFIGALLFDHLAPASDFVLIPFYVLAYLLVGYDVLGRAIQNIRVGQVFDEFFLMSVATVGALLIGEYPEAIAVMLFYKLGEYFQDKAVDSARGSIQALINIKPDFANVVLPNGAIAKRTPEEVEIGDIIEVKAGERIPLDGEIMEGNTSLDMAALTGETKPVDVGVGDAVLPSVSPHHYPRSAPPA